MPNSKGLMRFAQGAESGAPATLRILLVDGDPSYGERLSTMLRSQADFAFDVLQIRNLASAVAVLTTSRAADVILLDLELPDSRGIDTAILALQIAEEAPIIVLARPDNEIEAWHATRYGAQGVVSRDVTTGESLIWALHYAAEQCLLRSSLERNIRELELSNGRFLSLVVDNADAIVVLDRVGIVRFVNPSAEKLLRCSASELMGQMFGIPLEGGHTTEIDLCGRPDHVRTAEIRVMRTLWDGERAFIVTMRDITERKKSEKALRLAKQTAEQASAMKSQFLANMSHELRTPLNAIIGYSEMMMMGIAGEVQPSRYRSYIEDIHCGGKHLLSLINELLDLSKAESGKLELLEENFDLVALAEGTIDLLGGQAERKGVMLKLSSPLPIAWVHADERMMKQVILNLVGNAIKFTPTGGCVEATINRSNEGEIRILVRDNGIGIPTEQIPRAFAAFVQIQNAYMREENTGTGLGLALCKRYVEMHEGKITLESEVNVGTRVTVTLPQHRTLTVKHQGGGVVPLASGTSQSRKRPRISGTD